MLKKFLIVILSCVITQTVRGENLKIGAILDLSGDYADVGNAFLEGLSLAVDEVNQAGGVEGQQLELVVEDTHYNMAQVASAARKLLSIDKVRAAVITTYTEIKVAGPTFEAAGVPLVALWDSAPQIEALGDYVFGIGAWTPSAGETAATFAGESLNGKTAAIINTNGEWSLDVSSIFKRRFEALGGRVIEEISLNPSDTDFKSAILRVKKLAPDVLYAPLSDNIVPFFKQLSMLKFKAPVLTSDVISENAIENLRDAAEGIYQTQTATPETSATRHMLELYRVRYSKECVMTLFTAWAYDSIRLFTEAVKKGDPSSDGIRKALYQIKNFPGASGSLTISPEGSARTIENMFQIRNGRFQLVGTKE